MQKKNPEHERKLEILRKRKPEDLSLLERFILLPDEEKKKRYKMLTPKQRNKLISDPRFRGRPNQQLPAPLLDPSDNAQWMWLMNWGRMTGKTDTSASWVNYLAETNPGLRVAIIGTTAAEVRDALVNGPSGIISLGNPDCMPVHYPSASCIKWPNGSIALTFSAEEPESLRSQQFHVAWLDELAKWRYQDHVWEQIPFIMRLTRQPGFTTWVKPIVLISTTPRPTKLIRQLMADKDEVITTTVSSYANEANINSKTAATLRKLEGTRLGRQEIHAELLDDNPNGISGFSYTNFDANRITDPEHIRQKMASMVKIVIAVDPAITATKRSDETGIIIAGKDEFGHGYVIHDGSQREATPLEWATHTMNLFIEHQANEIVVEVNQGGDMVKTILSSINSTAPIVEVHATRGKYVRAEPIGTLYEQNLIHHLGTFPDLETQMVDYNPELGSKQKSPDRMDALVWAFTHLFITPEPEEFIMFVDRA